MIEAGEPVKKFQEQLQWTLSQRNSLIDSLGLELDLARYMKGVYKNQAGVIATIETMAKTYELVSLQKELIANNLFALERYINNLNTTWNVAISMNDVIQRSIPAQNIAYLKLVAPLTKYKLPYGGKTIVRNLSKSAAMCLCQTDKVMFDPEDRAFYHVDTPEQKISANEITVVESSLELFSSISISELISFESQLFEDMTFAIQHPVGQKIYRIISEWTDFISFDKTTYFHARKIEENGQTYLDQEMLKAPTNLSGHGRYNAIGKSCYYFADSIEGAVSEIRKHCRNQKPDIQVAEIKPCKSIKLIDLSKQISKGNKFMEHMRYTVDNDDVKIKKQYLLPNFVASCCKKLGIDGIKYISGQYYCYVTWKDDYFEFVDRIIVETEPFNQ